LRELREEVKESEETVPIPERWNFLRCLREFDAPMRWLLVSDILVRFCERIPFAWVVIFAMDYAGASGEQVGLLTTIEVLVATLCIIPSSHFADKQQREPLDSKSSGQFSRRGRIWHCRNNPLPQGNTPRTAKGG